MEKCYHNILVTYAKCEFCDGYDSRCMLYITPGDIHDHLIDFQKLNLESKTFPIGTDDLDQLCGFETKEN